MADILNIPFQSSLKSIMQDSIIDIGYKVYNTVFGKSIDSSDDNSGNGSGSGNGSTSLSIMDEDDETPYSVFDIFVQFFPRKLFNILLVSFFITHATMLLATSFIVKQTNASNPKYNTIINVLKRGSLAARIGYVDLRKLFCTELCLGYLLAFLFWKNDLLILNYYNFDEDNPLLMKIGKFELNYSTMSYYSSNMVFYLIIATIPWAIGLVKHIWISNLQFDEFGKITSMSMRTKSRMLGGRSPFSSSNAYHAMMFNSIWLFSIYLGQLMDILLFIQYNGQYGSDEDGFVSLSLLFSDPMLCASNSVVLFLPLWLLSFVWLPMFEEFVWATGF